MPRILIIDDEDLIRDILREMLERAGYEVVDAPDGRIGLTLYRQAPTDLVITDIFMAGKEGLETIRELRRDFPQAKIIAISGGSRIFNFDGLALARRFGVARTFAKPFDYQEILTAVREVLAAEETS